MITNVKSYKGTLFLIFWVIFVVAFGAWLVQQENRQTDLIKSTQAIKTQTKSTVTENQEILKDIKEMQANQGKMIGDMKRVQENQQKILEQIRQHEQYTIETIKKFHPKGQ